MSPTARVLITSLPKAPASAADVAKMLRAGKATGLPGMSEGLSYKWPALKVGCQWLIGARQAGVYVIVCPLIEKELLIERAPAVYFDTDHHQGYAAVLAWAGKISAGELADRIARAWHLQAPKKLQRAWEGAKAAPPRVRSIKRRR